MHDDGCVETSWHARVASVERCGGEPHGSAASIVDGLRAPLPAAWLAHSKEATAQAAFAGVGLIVSGRLQSECIQMRCLSQVGVGVGSRGGGVEIKKGA